MQTTPRSEVSSSALVLTWAADAIRVKVAAAINIEPKSYAHVGRLRGAATACIVAPVAPGIRNVMP